MCAGRCEVLLSGVRFSVIVPLYNRPDEIRELLESLTLQTVTDFEVIVVEDGSVQDARDIVSSFSDRLDIHYFWKENERQGFTRNFGFERAKGEWMVVFDSDCLIPATYFEHVAEFLDRHPEVDVFGGPDAAHPSFTPIQKAISHSMTSFLTTGGIRGGKKQLGTQAANRFQSIPEAGRVFRQGQGQHSAVFSGEPSPAALDANRFSLLCSVADSPVGLCLLV